MRGRFKRKDPKERGDERADFGAGFSPLSGDPAAGSVEPHRPGPGFAVQDGDGRKKGGTSELTGPPAQGEVMASSGAGW